MLTIAGLYNAFSKLNTDKIIEDSFEESELDFVEENRDQMLHGLNRDGKRIGKYKNTKYAIKKNKLNGLAGFGNVDLKLTGDLHAGIAMKVSGNSVVTESTDEKSVYQVLRYGEEIYGLGGEFKMEFVDTTLMPKVREKITEATGLGFS